MNEILIYSDIGESFFGDSVSAVMVKDQLKDMTGDISVRVNSPGGDVFDGFAIFNLLDQHDGKVTIHIDGLAASAASVVAMAGDEIVIADNALMMIHDPWTMSVGNAADMRGTADLLDKIRDSIVTTYMTKTNLPIEEVTAMMGAETWFSAAESVANGFATSTTTKSKTTAQNIAKPWIMNCPKPEQLPTEVEANTSWRVAINRRRLNLL
jgi:ATP-dependent protease ClpP protease subunit